MQLTYAKTEQKWLENLQKALIQDRIEEIGQASPLYYAIQDIKEVVTAPGYEDRTAYHDDESSTSYDSIQEIFQTILDNDYDTLYDLASEDNAGLSLNQQNEIQIADEEDFTAYLEEQGYTSIAIQDMNYIAPNTLFLTRNAAKKHLQENAHHYNKNAYTYAMTAWRSPDVEHLLELLFQIDWTNSHITLRIPKGWWYAADIQNRLHMLVKLQHITEEQSKELYRIALQNIPRINPRTKEMQFEPNQICHTIYTTMKNMGLDTKTIPSFSSLYHITITHQDKQQIQKAQQSGTWILDYYHEAPYHTLEITQHPNEGVTFRLKEKTKTKVMVNVPDMPHDQIIELKAQTPFDSTCYVWIQ